jgi:transcriptional regulator of arginine metabolism
MPTAARNQTDRREALRELLLDGPAPNQRRLVDALTRRGFDATQSSVSRDLREIGAVRTGAGYELPSRDETGGDELDGVADLLRRLTPAGPNLLVIRTATGAAQRVALALDRRPSPDVVGTVAGDDTVFVATPDARSMRRVISRMQRNARG